MEIIQLGREKGGGGAVILLETQFKKAEKRGMSSEKETSGK